MLTWIAPLSYRLDRKSRLQTATAGKPFGECGPGETDPTKLEYRAAVKTCIILHGFVHAGWGGVIYRDWPVAGRVFRFYSQG